MTIKWSGKVFSMILIILISFHVQPNNSLGDFTFANVGDILTFGQETIMELLKILEIVDNLPGNTEAKIPFISRQEKILKNHIREVSHKLDVYQEKTEAKTEKVLEQLMINLPKKLSMENDFHEFDHYVGQINDLYDVFIKYATTPEAYERFTLENFAKASVSSDLGALSDVLKTLHRLIVPNQSQLFNRSIIIAFSNQMKESSSQFCSEQQSPQQLLFHLYNTIAITEIKGYTMIQFSYMLLRLYISGSNFTEEMESLKQQYAVRTSETLRAVKTAMAFAPQDFWRCDPFRYEQDKTYVELNQLFQGYIVNEVDLNGGSTCRENCAYYVYAKIHGCYDNQFCAQQRMCSGKLVNCEFIDSDMWVCPSKDSSRRYDYIEYENGKVFGQKQTCQKSVTKVDSWWRWLFWHCSYCFCYCDDHNSSSDRYFNLRPVIADINNNKVITGIKLTKSNKIIHIQIQEGELLPRGAINSKTVAWKPVDNYTVYDSNVDNGVDYHTIVWEKRAIDLDDLKSPENHLLTGIKLRMIGTRLNLEIMVTPFNFTTGKLIQPSEKSYWISNDNTDRKELKLKNADIPIRSELQHVSDSGENQYLNFGPSDREKDAAQSTIPFLDIQPVEPIPAVPIAGAGIFHKGRPGSGGFLTLKLITYNFAPHLHTDLPPSPPVIEKYNEITAV
ncbi:PREDICTED: uncharacterized protein LOC106783674 isoform X1 [Polistes canadensis]|uniref:uncharacterized protein LOC106783674 isoform X1 n=1 Tax=Polistes canadensis TaxID=91411 RepID=UPI000718C9A3|nr:PREDICTED: uncharacterized protein LOC106783674 isoform X1 [Polistes canadensis]